MTSFLRPHDEVKYMESRPVENDIQPSPLALLAATCSKIGESLEQDRRELSANGIVSKYSEDVSTSVCFSDSNEFSRVCLRNEEFDSGRHHDHEHGKLREPCAYTHSTVLQQRPLIEELRLRSELCQVTDGTGFNACLADTSLKTKYVQRKQLPPKSVESQESSTTNSLQVSNHEVAKRTYDTQDYQSTFMPANSCKLYETESKRALSVTEDSSRMLSEFPKPQLASCLHGKRSLNNGTGMNLDNSDSIGTKPSCMWEQPRERTPIGHCIQSNDVGVRSRLQMRSHSHTGDMTSSPPEIHAQPPPQNPQRFQYLSSSPPQLNHSHNISAIDTSIHKQDIPPSPNSQFHSPYMSPQLPPVLSHQNDMTESPVRHYQVSQSQPMFQDQSQCHRQQQNSIRMPYNAFPQSNFPNDQNQGSLNTHLQHADVDRARYNPQYQVPNDYSEAKWFSVANTISNQIRMNPAPNMTAPPSCNVQLPQVGLTGNQRPVMSVPQANNVEMALQMNHVDLCSSCVPNTPPCPDNGTMVTMACDPNQGVLGHAMPDTSTMMNCATPASPVLNCQPATPGMMMNEKLYHDNSFPSNGQPMNPLRTLEEQENYAMYVARTELGRRPRRIACTCPNCRDGENKTVTTKDGKSRKLHVCHIPGCGKIYGKTSHLRAHLRWHSGERPFICNWLFCNKRFTRSDELQRHRRTHTGEKRFQCSICSKKFMRSDHLSKHTKTHQAQESGPAKGNKLDELGDTEDTSSQDSQFVNNSTCNETDLVQASMVLVNQDGHIKMEGAPR